MKFTKDTRTQHSITAYDDGVVTIDGVDYHDSLIVSAERLITDWAVGGVDAIDETPELEQLLAEQPELVVLGTGETQRFPAAETLAHFARRGIGLEVMTTAAACRTYNVLLSESRRVTAGLILR